MSLIIQRVSRMLVGQKLGPFAIEKELGSGAMGTVYLARNEETGRNVAIKIVAPGLSSNEVAMARFKREATILKSLEHPNIVHLIATGRLAKTPFYAMEYVEGDSLDRVMARRGRISWEEVVALGEQLCEALKHAHEKSIVHRDLKPSNIMVLPDGTLKLMDFGIAKALDIDMTTLTGANNTVGTAAYMSPEQCRGDRELTPKTDLYSMGVMFYELLTGKKPFAADSAMEMFMQHVNGTFERPSRLVLDIPVWLDTLVCQLLEKDPDKRPYSAELVGQALSRVKEKVEAQTSAGVDSARSRATARTKLDETDKEAARTLLGRRRKKKAKLAFYQQSWFQGVVLSLLLASIAVVIYWAFLPPSAESLYVRTQELMESGAGRSEAKQVIEQFLSRYPDHSRAGRMSQWADAIVAQEEDASLRARIRLARSLKREFEPAHDAEGLAYWAVRYGDFGDLPLARDRWLAVKQKAEKDTSQRGLSLLAERQLRDVEAKAPIPKADEDKEKEKADRAALLQRKLDEAAKAYANTKLDEARTICEDIVEMYRSMDDVQPQVAAAQKLLKLMQS